MLAGGFRTGVNLPWIRYGCDFGANAWHPNGGLASAGVPEPAQRALAQFHDAGGTLLRWFVFADGRSGIRSGEQGPTGVDEAFWKDIETGLGLADRVGVDVIFTLFDFHLCARSQMVNGVQLGGRRQFVRDDGIRAALLDNVLAPLFGRFGRHPRIAAWDVINEPEWVTGGVRSRWPWSRVGRSSMRRFISEVTALAHELTPKPVTVGSASGRWLDLVAGLGLDFYQVHWYDQIDGAHPPTTWTAHVWDRPVLLGEFPTRHSAHATDVFIDGARHAGYAGALAWSLLADDAYSCGADRLVSAFGAELDGTRERRSASDPAEAPVRL